MKPFMQPAELSRFDWLCKWFSILVGIPLILFLLFGCAPTPYWVKMNEPALVTTTVRHATPEALERACAIARRNIKLMGCTVRNFYQGKWIAVIHLHPKAGECEEKHEKAHADGWVHDERDAYILDCGPE